MPRKILRCEQETIISRTADEAGWNVYTCDPVMKRRMDKLTSLHTKQVSRREIDRDGNEYTIPLKWVAIRPPKQVSDATRAKLAARGAAVFAANRSAGVQARGRRLAARQTAPSSAPTSAAASLERNPAC